jgi:hypothetical protein
VAATASQVQTGTVTIAAADGASQSIPITDVDPTRAYAWVETSGGESGSGSVRAKRHVFRVRFTESVGGGGYDQLTWARYEGTSAQTVTMRWYVVELDAASSCQSVNLTCTADPTTTTSITAPTAGHLIVYGVATDQNFASNQNTAIMTLTQTTNPRDTLNVDFTSAPSGTQCVVDVFIADLGSDVTVQIVDITVAGTANSNTGSCSAVSGDYAILLQMKVGNGSAGFGRDPGRVSLSGTTVTVNATTYGSGGDRIFQARIVEFSDSTNVVTGLVSMSTAQASNTATSLSISDATRCTPMVGSSWQQNDVSLDSVGEACYFAQQAVSGTTLTVTRSATESAGWDTNYYIVEWQTAGGGGGAVPVFDHHYRSMRAA